MAMFLAGFPVSVPVHTLNRQCCSGAVQQSVVLAAQHIAPPERTAPAFLQRSTYPLHEKSAYCAACHGPPAGLQAVAHVAAAIRTGLITVGIAGGVESMSANPMAS